MIAFMIGVFVLIVLFILVLRSLAAFIKERVSDEQ